jgi:hypothetical protein
LQPNARKTVIGRNDLRTAQLSQRSETLDPEAADAIGAAFEAAWATHCRTGDRLSMRQTSDARVRIARVLMDCVRQGERDPSRLRERALASVDQPHDGCQLPVASRYL